MPTYLPVTLLQEARRLDAQNRATAVAVSSQLDDVTKRLTDDLDRHAEQLAQPPQPIPTPPLPSGQADIPWPSQDPGAQRDAMQAAAATTAQATQAAAPAPAVPGATPEAALGRLQEDAARRSAELMAEAPGPPSTDAADAAANAARSSGDQILPAVPTPGQGPDGAPLDIPVTPGGGGSLPGGGGPDRMRSVEDGQMGSAGGPLDHSSPQAYLASLLPYAAQVEQETGIPRAVLAAIPMNEQGWQKPAPGENIFGIKGENPDTGGSSDQPTWEVVNGQRVDTTAPFRTYSSPLESMRDFARFLRDNPRYGPALAALQQNGDPDTFVRNIHAAGYASDPDWATKVQSIMRQVPDSPAAASTPSPGAAPLPRLTTGVGSSTRPDETPSLSEDQVEFGRKAGLSYAEALAACGPVGLAVMLRAAGRTPNEAEAQELARQTGWTPGLGMSTGSRGIVDAMAKLNVPAQIKPLDWAEVASTVSAGKPVLVNSHGGAGGGHFWVAQGYDPDTGAFDFGKSAQTALSRSGGRRWMRPSEMASMGVGTPDEAIYLGAAAGAN